MKLSEQRDILVKVKLREELKFRILKAIMYFWFVLIGVSFISWIITIWI